MQVLNFCILYAKYYIYIQRLFNSSTLDLYACLTQLKQTLKIENICIKNKNEEKFFKFHFIYDNVQNNNESNACHYICMTQCKLPEII